MKHIRKHLTLRAILHYATVSFLVGGIAVLGTASSTEILAAGTSQGSTVLEMQWNGDEQEYHKAAWTPESRTRASQAMQLAIGSIFVFLGFVTHALLVIREDRPVPVRAGKRAQPIGLWIERFYWMEVMPRGRK